MPKAKDLKKGKIGTVEEFMELFGDEWVLSDQAFLRLGKLLETSIGREQARFEDLQSQESLLACCRD